MIAPLNSAYQKSRSTEGYERILEPRSDRLEREDRCLCGMFLYETDYYPGAKVRHRHRHDQHENGVKLLPKTLQLEDVRDNILAVLVGTKGPEVKVSYYLTRVAQRAGDYDFVSFWPGDRNGRYTAYIYIEADRAVGYLLGTTSQFWAEFCPSLQESEIHEERRPMVGLAFVCENWRGKGIASDLARRFAAEAGLSSPAELIWQLRFTPTGLALARSLGDGTNVLVGA